MGEPGVIEKTGQALTTALNDLLIHEWDLATATGQDATMPPGPSVANYPLVTYVTDGIASAMAQAKAAAGDRGVFVIGAYTAQHALEAGVLDELVIHQIPVLFGDGRRLFEVLPSRIELEIVRVIDTPEATHIHYRVRR